MEKVASERWQSILEQERPKRQKGREKLRSADMARLGFQYVLKKSSQQQHT